MRRSTSVISSPESGESAIFQAGAGDVGDCVVATAAGTGKLSIITASRLTRRLLGITVPEPSQLLKSLRRVLLAAATASLFSP